MFDRNASGEAYLLYHSIGQYPGKRDALAGALEAFAGAWSACDDGQWGAVLGRQQRFIDLWRGLVGAPEGTMATTQNVTTGLYSLIAALPEARLRGKKVLVAGDVFPSLHFLLSGLAPRLGFTLQTVPLRQGATWVEDEDVIAAWDAEVGLCLLTWVSSTSSHRCDVDRLVAHGREVGSLVGIDITQAAGLLPFDVTQAGVDFMLSTSLKWIGGTPGAGVLYLREALIGECRPELRGWFSQENPFSWDLDAFAYAPDARRFDNGTPPALAAVASVPALEWQAGLDRAALVAQNRRLAERLIAGIDDLGLRLASPRDAAQRGGSVMALLPADRPAGAVVDRLRDAGIYVDARGQCLRLSPGAVTTEAGVEAALEHLAQALHG